MIKLEIEEIKEKERRLIEKLDDELEKLREARCQGKSMTNKEKIEDIVHELAELPDLETEKIVTGKGALILVEDMQLLSDHRFRVKFTNGVEKVVCLRDLIEKGGVFAALRDPEIEKNITIVAGTPTWCNEKIDLDPCGLYECGLSADEEFELLAKLEAELEKAEECKRAGLPTYTMEQLLEMAEEILKEDGADEN